MTNLWRVVDLWLRDALNQHVKISEINKIFAMNDGDKLVNMVILATKELNFTKRIDYAFMVICSITYMPVYYDPACIQHDTLLDSTCTLFLLY